MSRFQRRALIRRNPVQEKRDILDIPGNMWNPAIIAQVLQGGTVGNSSNEIVNDTTALSISTVYTCTKILSDNIASLPCKLYKSAGTGTKQLAIGDPLYRLLTVESNPETSAYNFFSTVMMHLCLRGNAYVEIRRNPITGDVLGLWNLDPRRTEPVRLPEQNNALAYKTMDGEQEGQYRVIEAKNMLHFAINTWNGIVGQSPISCLRESAGLSLSMQKFMGRSMTNNAVPSVVLTNKSTLPMDPASKTLAREDWERLHTGSSARRVAVLDGDFSITPLQPNNVDLDLLAQRRFTANEIGSAYGVPAWMLGDTEKLTSASATQLALQFQQASIMPLCRMLETEMKRKLIPSDSPAHIAFDLRERLKGDFQTMLQTLSMGLQNGVYTHNEARTECNLDPVGPEGDVLTVQVNMTTLDRLTQSMSTDTNDDTGQQVEDSAELVPSLRHIVNAYRPLFENAVNAVRSSAPISQAFGPVIESLVELRASDFDAEQQAQLIVSVLQGIERRHSRGELDSADEMNRAIRSVVFAVHESAAKKELSEAA